MTVAPLLLFSAGHAKQDIPDAVEPLARELGLTLVYAEPFGVDPRIVELSAQRWLEAVADLRGFAAAESALLIVGRGSSDPEAVAATRAFAKARERRTPVARVEVCFAAVAEPLLATALEHVAAVGYRFVVVQPHLLFTGELSASIRHAVAGAARRHDGSLWTVAAHLGPSPQVSLAACERIRATDV